MQALWKRVQEKDCGKLQSDMVSAYGTCFAEKNICLTLHQKSTYLETLISVIRRSGPLNTAMLSQVCCGMHNIYVIYI